MSRVQVLVATMHQKDFSKLQEMNIQTDAVFANQSDTDRTDIRNDGGFTALMITTSTRGVGINRNIALEHASGEILLIADDDMRYIDGYENAVFEAFRQLPQADALIFNIDTVGDSMGRRMNGDIRRLHFFNAFNYGAARIAVRRERLTAAPIRFSLDFGGGAKYSAGEDSLFIRDMLRCGMKIFTFPKTIATVDQSDSSWFNGYNEKYFYDKGAFFCAMSRRLAQPLCLQDLLRHRNMYASSGFGIKGIYSHMRNGIKGYRSGMSYSDFTAGR